MVKHIILWKLKPDIDKQKISLEIKNGLESLKGNIEGLVDIKVITNHLSSSTADIMLDSTFIDAKALEFYAKHPEHLKVANGVVRPNTETRFAYDFEL